MNRTRPQQCVGSVCVCVCVCVLLRIVSLVCLHCSFQMTVEMFDYLECELNLFLAGNHAGWADDGCLSNLSAENSTTRIYVLQLNALV